MSYLFIEASTIGSGGGITHLREFIAHAKPYEYGFEWVELWASQKLLDQIPERPWLLKKSHPLLNGGFFKKIVWQLLYLPKELRKQKYLLFLPAGNDAKYHPKVSFCQNLQPFDPRTQKEYGWSITRLRLLALKWSQTKCYQSSDGMIYLTDYSMLESFKSTGDLSYKSVVIPHAVEFNKFHFPEKSVVVNPSPFKILYVSTIVFYKRQDVLTEAVAQLINEGLDLELTLIGSAYPPALKVVKGIIARYNLNEKQVRIISKTSHDELPKYYREADLFVMASSCETFGITLLEAMAAGLPVLCADNPSLRETLADSGEYYQTFSVEDLKSKIRFLSQNHSKREELALKSLNRAQLYTWQKTADRTLAFLRKVNESPSQFKEIVCVFLLCLESYFAYYC